MIIRIESEDGQEFIVRCGEQTGGLQIWTPYCGAPSQEPQAFTIEEAKAAIAALEFAIKIAEEEREEMEKRNGI